MLPTFTGRRIGWRHPEGHLGVSATDDRGLFLGSQGSRRRGNAAMSWCTSQPSRMTVRSRRRDGVNSERHFPYVPAGLQPYNHCGQHIFKAGVSTMTLHSDENRRGFQGSRTAFEQRRPKIHASLLLCAAVPLADCISYRRRPVACMNKRTGLSSAALRSNPA